MGYPHKQDVQERAAAGDPISQEEVTRLAREERDMTGTGSIAGGTAAQSVHDKQMNFIAKAGEIARKPSWDITREDAEEVRKREIRALGGGTPGPGSASAYVQDVAEQNERRKSSVQTYEPFMVSPGGHRRSL